MPSSRPFAAAPYSALILRTVLVTMLFEALTPVLPNIGADLGISQPHLQALLSLAVILIAVASLSAPLIIDRIGRRRAVTLSAIAVCACGLSSTVAPNYPFYAAAILAMYAANAFGSAANRALLRDVVQHDQYKRIFAFGQAALEVICILVPLVAAALAAAWGWRWMFATFCLAVLLVPVLFAWLVPKSAMTLGTSSPIPTPTPGGIARLCLTLWLPLILLCATQAGYSALLVAKPFLLAERFGLSLVSIGAVLSGFAGVGALGYLCSGALMKYVAERHLVIAGLILQAYATLALALLSETHTVALPLFLSALVAAQIGYCLIVPVANGWAMNVPQPCRSAVASMLLGLQALIGGAAAFFASIAYDGSAISVATVFGFSVFAAVLALLRMERSPADLH